MILNSKLRFLEIESWLKAPHIVHKDINCPSFTNNQNQWHPNFKKLSTNRRMEGFSNKTRLLYPERNHKTPNVKTQNRHAQRRNRDKNTKSHHRNIKHKRLHINRRRLLKVIHLCAFYQLEMYGKLQDVLSFVTTENVGIWKRNSWACICTIGVQIWQLIIIRSLIS